MRARLAFPPLLAALTLTPAAFGQVARTPTLHDELFSCRGAVGIAPDGEAISTFTGSDRSGDNALHGTWTADGGATWSPEQASSMGPSYTPFAYGTRFRGAASFTDDFSGCTRSYAVSADPGLLNVSGSALVPDPCTSDESPTSSASGFALHATDPSLDRSFLAYSWRQSTNSPQGVWLTRIDGDTTVLPQILLEDFGGDTSILADQTALAVDQDQVFVAWHDAPFQGNRGNVQLRTSADRGDSFAPATTVRASVPNIGVGSLELAVDGPLVAVSWVERSDDLSVTDLVVTLSTDGGVTFAPPFAFGSLFDFGIGTPMYSIDWIGGNPVLFWQTNTVSLGSILTTAVSTDLGASFTLSTLASSLKSSRGNFRTAHNASGMVVAIVVTDTDEVEALYSLDGGLSWSPQRIALGGPSFPYEGILPTGSLEVVVGPGGNVIVGWASLGWALGGFALAPTATSTPFSIAPNVDSLTADPPVVGETVGIQLDLALTGQASGVVLGSLGTAMTPLLGQFLLLDLSGPPAFSTGLLAGDPADFDASIPNLPTLLGTTMALQGAHLGAPGVTLTNRCDLVFGAF